MNVEIKRDGLTLRGELLLPSSDSFNLVIIMHGFTGNIQEELHVKLAESLLEKGYASLRFDFNGHGKSDGLFEDMTILNEIGDGKAILSYAQTIKGVKDISLLGHSQGGVVASMLAGYYPDVFKKLVLMAPAATLKDDALKGVCMDAKYDPKHIPEKVKVRDLYVGGFYFRTAQLLPIYETAKQYTGPVLLIHGNSDMVVDPIASQRYHDVYQNSTFNFMDGADHGFSGNNRAKAVKCAVEFLTGENND